MSQNYKGEEKYKKCLRMYWHLAKYTKKNIPNHSDLYFKDYLMTKECDWLHDLSKARKNYNDYFTEFGLKDQEISNIHQNLLKKQDLTEKEKRIVLRAVIQNWYENQDTIIRGLKPYLKVKFFLGKL